MSREWDRIKRIDGWGLLWRQENLLDGINEYLMWEHGKPLFFHSRAEARKYRTEKLGYIKQRADLQAEPHGWKVPLVVKTTYVIGMEVRRESIDPHGVVAEHR